MSIKPRTRERAILVFTMLVMASPAFAQGGNMNLTSGMQTLGTALLVVFGILVMVGAGYKGVEAVLDHRSIMPSMIGLIFGISMTFGGVWYLTQLGANTGGGGFNL